MTQLTLILRDFHPPEEAPADAGSRLERYPQFEAVLRYASRSQHTDWRRWLLAQAGLGAAGEGGMAEGAVAAWALPAASAGAGSAAWLATPVHFVAGLDTVRLHPAGILQLSDAEQQALAADFGRVFAGSGLALHALGERELLLTAPRAAAVAGTNDPARFLGRVPTPGMPSGEGSAPLRRLGAEIEMWLYGHAVNERRMAAGRLPISALWLWGGGEPGGPSAGGAGGAAGPAASPVVLPVAPQRTRSLPRLLGHDLFTRGLTAGAHDAPEPEALPATLAQAGELTQDCIALLPTLGESGRIELGALESTWFAPALAVLDAGRIGTVRVVVGRSHFVLGRHRRWRRWRALRPWWEQLQ